MINATWSVFIAFLVPYVAVILAKSGKGYSNHTPREYLTSLSGWRARANYAQMNSFEAFGPFAASVVLATLHGVSQITIDQLAFAFAAARILYVVFYIMDKAALRSLCWTGGWVSVVSLFVMAGRSV